MNSKQGMTCTVVTITERMYMCSIQHNQYNIEDVWTQKMCV